MTHEVSIPSKASPLVATLKGVSDGVQKRTPSGLNQPWPLPASCQRLMGFDYGPKRTGVAAGNRLTVTAQELGHIKASGDLQMQQACKWVKDWQPDALVVGVPLHPDGAAHDMTRKATAFALRLHQSTGKPVYTVDERYSTTAAHSWLGDAAEGAPKGAAGNVDAVSASIILEQFLRSVA